jgi:hypothetical protein
VAAYEDYCLLGRDTVQFSRTSLRFAGIYFDLDYLIVSQASSASCLINFDPEKGVNAFLREVHELSPDCTVTM